MNRPDTPFDLENESKNEWDIKNFLVTCKSKPPFGMNTSKKKNAILHGRI